MKKEKLKRLELVASYDCLYKYSTQVDNVYIYDAQLGWGYDKNIEREQVDERSDIYGEHSVIVTHKDFINGNFCGGIANIKYTSNLNEKYYIQE